MGSQRFGHNLVTTFSLFRNQLRESADKVPQWLLCGCSDRICDVVSRVCILKCIPELWLLFFQALIPSTPQPSLSSCSSQISTLDGTERNGTVWQHPIQLGKTSEYTHTHTHTHTHSFSLSLSFGPCPLAACNLEKGKMQLKSNCSSYPLKCV